MSESKNPFADTAEVPAVGQSGTASPGVGRVRIDCAGRTHQGFVRTNNEDHFYISRFGRFLMPLATNVSGQAETLFEEEGHGLVVADGMGGAAAGEWASSLAIQTMLRLVIQTPDWILAAEGPEVDRVLKRMAERFVEIDQVLLNEAEKHAKLHGMGTTMTVAANYGSSMILTHVGDSRAYLYRGGTLHQLTQDHTLAQALVDQGYLTHVREATLQVQHTLVKALGGLGHRAQADVQRLTLLDRDTLLLCTDGLTDMMPDPEIVAVLGKAVPAADLADQLVQEALAKGGKDNVTVIVARYAFVNRPEAPVGK
jgi:PPM family protein phosphatase